METDSEAAEEGATEASSRKEVNNVNNKKKQSAVPSSASAANPVTGRVVAPPVTPAILAATEPVVATLVSTLDGAILQVPGLFVVSTSMKPKILKTRDGCETYIASMAGGMAKFPSLIPADIDPVELANAVAYVAELAKLQTSLASLTKAVDDTMLAQRGSAWSTALEVYTIFQRQLASHPELEPLVAPMAAYLAEARKGKAGGDAPDSGASSGTVPEQGAAGGTATGSSTAGTPSGGTAAPGGSGGVPVYYPDKK